MSGLRCISLQAQQRIWRRVQHLGQGATSAAGQRAGGIYSRSSSPAQAAAQQQQQQHPEAQTSVIVAAIESAVQGCVEAGQLPAGSYSWPQPSRPSAKQANLLPSNVR